MLSRFKKEDVRRDSNILCCGIDQSFACSGLAVTDGKTILVTRYVTDDKQTTYERIVDIAENVRAIKFQLQPKTMVIEQAAETRLQGSMQTLIKLHQLEFKLIDTLTQIEQPFKTLSATKTALTGWPKILECNGTKDKFREHLIRLGVELPQGIDNNEIDAIGLTWASLVLDGLKEPDELRQIQIIRINSKEQRGERTKLTSFIQQAGNL